MVSTRSPDKTEDIDFGIGHAIICEGHKVAPHIGFIDAHNCLGDEIDVILPGTKTAYEYFTAAVEAMDRWETEPLTSLKVGYAHLPLPYTREEGIGDIGLQVLITDTGGVTTAYILIDGNNMVPGVREFIQDEVKSFVDEVEVMTTDTHVVNTISGKNPVGHQIPADELTTHVLEGVTRALADRSDAQVAGSSATCNGVIIFGSDTIAQLASIVNTILVYVLPISAGMLLLAVVLSVIAYMVIT
jgi:putative membrane protein